jgi:hypothetical protein
MNKDSKELIEQMQALIDKPAGKQAVRFILNSLGAIPFAGGIISAGSSIWSEKEQQDFNEALIQWASKTDGDVKGILEKINQLLQTPTRTKLTLLLGEVIGDELANQFLSKSGHQILLMLHSFTIEELQPFVQKKWLSMTPTHSTCSMGADNRTGHIEEKKRPWGLGAGFILTVNELFFLPETK